ncbi:MAG: branched-chain-amino-acid transaminase [Gammaproteobacteria bacterium]|nr:branched-chain-amino-acid transaminase [Gammaproteobacteria bacterium]
MSNSVLPLCWIESEIVPASEAKIGVLDHGLLYGDGVFEGIRFYNKKLFYWPAHLRRLRDSANAICLELPLNDAELETLLLDLIEAYAGDSGYIRLVVTRGIGSLGISPVSCKRPGLFAIVDQLSMITTEQRSQGIRVITASTRRLPLDGLSPQIKSLNYLNHILARIEAQNANAQEAIVLNAQGKVTEGTTDNVFIVRDGVLLTPPVNDGALAGITRQIIMELAAEMQIENREQSMSTYDIYTADECFLTGTGAELIPVREVDGRSIRHCPGPVFQQMSEAFNTLIAKSV